MGSAGIKIIELTRQNSDRVFLNNYVLAETPAGSSLDITKSNAQDLALLLSNLLDKAGIKTKEAVISLPVGETFSTIIEMPPMSEAELASAIPYQAKKYIPIPLEEVVLDWTILGQIDSPDDKKNVTHLEAVVQNQSSPVAKAAKTTQVLIVAVPQEVIRKIAQIAKNAKLRVLSLEQEAFSIIRSLIGSDQATYLLIDLGEKNIDLIIVDKGVMRFSYTFEKNRLSDFETETAKIVNLFQDRHQKKVSQAILVGGGATDIRWYQSISRNLALPVVIGDPFARVAHEPKIGAALKQIGPFMAVAVGAAMREI